LAQSIFDEKIAKQIESRAGSSPAGLQGPEQQAQGDPGQRSAQYRRGKPSHGDRRLKAWGAKTSKKYVDISTSKKIHKAAKPFIEWLENAESDEESEEDNARWTDQTVVQKCPCSI
jgi:translation initiation factor 5